MSEATFTQDPLDESFVIFPNGNLGRPVFITEILDPSSPRVSELLAGTAVGWFDPEQFTNGRIMDD